MKLTKTRGKNEFTFSELTLGQLLAIQRALEDQDKRDKLGAVGSDVLQRLHFAPFDLIRQGQAQSGAVSLANVDPYY